MYAATLHVAAFFCGAAAAGYSGYQPQADERSNPKGLIADNRVPA
jgi:hypothetical protein